MTPSAGAMDRDVRLSKYIEHAPRALLEEVRSRLGLIIGLQLPPAP